MAQREKSHPPVSIAGEYAGMGAKRRGKVRARHEDAGGADTGDQYATKPQSAIRRALSLTRLDVVRARPAPLGQQNDRALAFYYMNLRIVLQSG